MPKAPLLLLPLRQSVNLANLFRHDPPPWHTPTEKSSGVAKRRMFDLATKFAGDHCAAACRPSLAPTPCECDAGWNCCTAAWELAWGLQVQGVGQVLCVRRMAGLRE